MRRSGWLALLLVALALLISLFWRRPPSVPRLPFPLANLSRTWPGEPNYWRDDLRVMSAEATPALAAELNRRYLGESPLLEWVRSRLPLSWAKYLPDASGARQRRQSALWALGEIGLAASNAVPQLIRHRDRTSDFAEKSLAVIALTKILPQDPVIRSNFLGLLSSPQQTERFYAAQEFGALPFKSAEELIPLVTALSDSDGEVRANAAFSLARFGPLGIMAVPVLRSLLTNDYRHVPVCAAYALAAISPQHVGVALVAVTNSLIRRADLSESVAPAFFRTAGASAVSAVPFLEARIAANNSDWAVVAVCQVSPAPSSEAIARLAKYNQFNLPELALLRQIGPAASNAVPQIQAMVRGIPSLTFRTAAQAALGRITNSVPEIGP